MKNSMNISQNGEHTCRINLGFDNLQGKKMQDTLDRIKQAFPDEDGFKRTISQVWTQSRDIEMEV